MHLLPLQILQRTSKGVRCRDTNALPISSYRRGRLDLHDCIAGAVDVDQAVRLLIVHER